MAPKRNRQSEVLIFDSRSDANLAAVKTGGRMSPKALKIKDPSREDNSKDELSDDTFNGDTSSAEEKEKKKPRTISDLDLSLVKDTEEETENNDLKKILDEFSDSSMDDSHVLIDSVPDIDMDIPKYKLDSPIKKVLLDSDDDDDVFNHNGSNSLSKKIKKNIKAMKKIRTGLNSTMTPKAAESYKNRVTKKYKLPPILSLHEIKDKCKPYLSVALDILDGKRQSGYYPKAKQMAKESNVSYLSTNEMRRLDLQYFFAGYYGLMRQYLVGQMIVNEYKDKLERNKSPVLRWWGADDFSAYVLAPDVLTELCISEMGFKPKKNEDEVDVRDRVFTLFENTRDFGLKIADRELN